MGNSLSASLLLAARTGNANGVKQLLDQGADIHITFEDEKTALHVAAEEGKHL
jgi:ankyrin repeat protein